MKPVLVIYEDSAAGGDLRNYGPHLLLLQCIADGSGLPSWELKRHLFSHPARSNSKVQSQCNLVPPQIGTDGSHVVAVYDRDKVHKILSLPKGACKTQMRGVLLGQTGLAPQQLSVVFLEDNLETVLQELQVCAATLDPALATKEEWDRAILRKNLLTRDSILQKASRPSPSAESVRAALLQRMPSLSYLAWRVACAALAP